MNLGKFVKISESLDNLGLFTQADKIDQFVKLSQYALMPSQYKPTGVPRTGNPLIDAAFTNPESSAFGNYLSQGRQYDRFAPYKSEFGPEGPAILPTLTPTQFAKMEQEGRFQDIFDLQILGGLQAQKYLAMGNENLIGLSTLVAQYARPEVSENVRQSFFKYVLPTTISRMIVQDLETRPNNQWQGRINEYVTELSKSAPKQLSIIKEAIKTSLNTLMRRNTSESKSFVNKLRSDPNAQNFVKDLDLSVPIA